MPVGNSPTYTTFGSLPWNLHSSILYISPGGGVSSCRLAVRFLSRWKKIVHISFKTLAHLMEVCWKVLYPYYPPRLGIHMSHFNAEYTFWISLGSLKIFPGFTKFYGSGNKELAENPGNSLNWAPSSRAFQGDDCLYWLVQWLFCFGKLYCRKNSC